MAKKKFVPKPAGWPSKKQWKKQWNITALVVGLVIAGTATAQSKDCQSVYNPHTRQWEYQCVERGENDYRPPVCRQEYDAMNRVWVTVCE